MKISNFCSTRLALYSSPGSSHSHWYSCVPREGQHVPGLVSYISGHHTRTNHDVWYILLWETSLCVIQHYYVSNSTHSFFYYVCIFFNYLSWELFIHGCFGFKLFLFNENQWGRSVLTGFHQKSIPTDRGKQFRLDLFLDLSYFLKIKKIKLVKEEHVIIDIERI